MTRVLLKIALTIVIVDLIGIAYAVGSIILCENSIDSALKLLSPLLVLLGGTVALATLLTNISRNNSKDYLDKAVTLIERAYNVLAESSENGIPKNDRVIWLTCARMIKSSQNLSKKITEKSHKDIYFEQTRYWRSRFYELLKIKEGSFPPEYYAESTKSVFINRPGVERESLDVTSLAVIYRFTQWPEEEKDPIDDVPKFTKAEIERMRLLGPKGLREHLQRIEEFLVQNVNKK